MKQTKLNFKEKERFSGERTKTSPEEATNASKNKRQKERLTEIDLGDIAKKNKT